MGKANRTRQKKTSEESRTLSGRAVLIFGSTALALVLGLVPSAVQIAGVTSMMLAHLLMFISWLVAVIWLKESREYTVTLRLVSVLIVSVVLGGFAHWIAKERAKIDAANAPKGSVQLSKIDIPRAYPSIAVGKQFGVNWHFTNPGPGRLFNVLQFHSAYVKEVNEQTSQRVRTLFENELKQYLAGKPKGDELGSGEEVWITIPSPPLTQQQYEGVLKETTRMYFVAQLMWKDAHGYEAPPYYRCVWLQADSYPSARRVEDLAWHLCGSEEKTIP